MSKDIKDYMSIESYALKDIANNLDKLEIADVKEPRQLHWMELAYLTQMVSRPMFFRGLCVGLFFGSLWTLLLQAIF